MRGLLVCEARLQRDGDRASPCSSADACWAAVVEKILMMSVMTRIAPGHPDLLPTGGGETLGSTSVGLQKPSWAPRAATAQPKAERGAQNRVNTFVVLENRPALKDVSAWRERL